MNNISQNIRYYPHDLNTKFYSVQLYMKGYPLKLICRKYHISNDFLKRAIVYFGYKPQILQTDNDTEFTHTKNTKLIHPLDVLCENLSIQHKLIRPRTPRHNGKVERSHRNDQQRFYSYLSFYSYDDLLKQIKAYLKRSNNIPMQVLNWLTTFQKREQLKKQC